MKIGNQSLYVIFDQPVPITEQDKLRRSSAQNFWRAHFALDLQIFSRIGKLWKIYSVPLYQISVYLENFRFWDQICPKKC